jgi:hypothetical protein
VYNVTTLAFGHIAAAGTGRISSCLHRASPRTRSGRRSRPGHLPPQPSTGDALALVEGSPSPVARRPQAPEPKAAPVLWNLIHWLLKNIGFKGMSEETWQQMRAAMDHDAALYFP